MNNISWLPEKILQENYLSLISFITAVEEAYKNDFIRNSVLFKGNRVQSKKHPIRHNGEDSSFWHLTTTGHGDEDQRQRSFTRCEKIKWIKAIIINCSDLKINVWEEEKKVLFHFRISEINTKEKDHLVVIEKRKKYYLLWTAYEIDYAHYSKKLIKRFNKSQKTEGAPADAF